MRRGGRDHRCKTFLVTIQRFRAEKTQANPRTEFDKGWNRRTAAIESAARRVSANSACVGQIAAPVPKINFTIDIAAISRYDVEVQASRNDSK